MNDFNFQLENIKLQFQNINSQFENLSILLKTMGMGNPNIKNQIQNTGIQILNIGIQMINIANQMPYFGQDNLNLKEQLQNIDNKIQQMIISIYNTNNNIGIANIPFLGMQIPNMNVNNNMGMQPIMGNFQNNMMNFSANNNNIKKYNLIFKFHSTRLNIILDANSTLKEAKIKFFSRLKEELGELNAKGKNIIFLYNGYKININDNTKISDFFKDCQSPTIIANDIKDLYGGY